MSSARDGDVQHFRSAQEVGSPRHRLYQAPLAEHCNNKRENENENQPKVYNFHPTLQMTIIKLIEKRKMIRCVSMCFALLPTPRNKQKNTSGKR